MSTGATAPRTPTFNMTLTGTLGTQNHTYADGPATRTVSVKVTDKNGASDTKTFTVAVANVAPTVDAAPADQSVGQRGRGADLQLHRSAIRAPTRSFGGRRRLRRRLNAIESDATNTDSGGLVQVHVRRWARELDGDGHGDRLDGDASNETRQTVTVANVAPTVTLAAGNDLSVNEGSTAHLQLHDQRSGRGHGLVGGDVLRR